MALITPVPYQQQNKYPASFDRFVLENMGVQAGAVGGTHLKVTPAGASYQLSIAAGQAWVQAIGTRMGRYLVINDATDTATIAAAHATNPRIDQIIVRVKDAADLGDVTNTPTFEVIQGTATSGATLDNRTGAASLPSNSLRLADILVPSVAAGFTGTFVQNTHIRDRRPWARGAFARAIQTSGAGYTTTSTSYVAIDDTNLLLRLECSGNPMVVTLRGGAANSSANAINSYQLRVDGVTAEGTEGIPATSATANASLPLAVSRVVIPAAGSHTFSWWWKVSGGTGTLQRGTDYFTEVTVEELVRSDASNTGA